VKSPADTAEAHSESDDEAGSPRPSSDATTDATEADPIEAEPTESDTTESDPAESEEDGLAPGRPRGRSAVRWIAAAVLVAVLAVAGVEGWQLFQHHQRDVAAAQALEAAEEFTLTLTTIDPNAIATNVSDVLDGSTGEFKDLYRQSSEHLSALLIENKATARGMVIDSGIKSATKDKVEVVLFVDQAVSNATSPEPQLDRSRVVMTMEKVDGRWLASKVDLP
jgi:Mce-associated membrane protein